MKKGNSTTIEVMGAVILVLILVLVLVFASKTAVFNVVKKVKEKDISDANNTSSDVKDEKPHSLGSYANKKRVNKIAETIGKSNKNSQYIQRKKCGYIISDYCYMLSGDDLFNNKALQSSQQ